MEIVFKRQKLVLERVVDLITTYLELNSKTKVDRPKKRSQYLSLVLGDVSTLLRKRLAK